MKSKLKNMKHYFSIFFSYVLLFLKGFVITNLIINIICVIYITYNIDSYNIIINYIAISNITSNTTIFFYSSALIHLSFNLITFFYLLGYLQIKKYKILYLIFVFFVLFLLGTRNVTITMLFSTFDIVNHYSNNIITLNLIDSNLTTSICNSMTKDHTFITKVATSVAAIGFVLFTSYHAGAPYMESFRQTIKTHSANADVSNITGVLGASTSLPTQPSVVADTLADTEAVPALVPRQENINNLAQEQHNMVLHSGVVPNNSMLASPNSTVGDETIAFTRRDANEPGNEQPMGMNREIFSPTSTTTPTDENIDIDIDDDKKEEWSSTLENDLCYHKSVTSVGRIEENENKIRHIRAVIQQVKSECKGFEDTINQNLLNRILSAYVKLKNSDQQVFLYRLTDLLDSLSRLSGLNKWVEIFSKYIIALNNKTYDERTEYFSNSNNLLRLHQIMDQLKKVVTAIPDKYILERNTNLLLPIRKKILDSLEKLDEIDKSDDCTDQQYCDQAFDTLRLLLKEVVLDNGEKVYVSLITHTFSTALLDRNSILTNLLSLDRRIITDTNTDVTTPHDFFSQNNDSNTLLNVLQYLFTKFY